MPCMLLAGERTHSMKEKKRLGERPPQITEGELLAYLAKTDRPQSIREMASALGLRHGGRRALPKLLGRLKRRGDVQVEHGRYRLTGQRSAPAPGPRPVERHDIRPGDRSASRAPEESAEAAARPARQDPNLIAGRLVAHRDGYGFVVPDTPRKRFGRRPVYRARRMGDAMHGDHVQARLSRRHGDGRAEGRIVRVIDRAHPTSSAFFATARAGTRCALRIAPAQEIIIPPGDELTPELQGKLRRIRRAARDERVRLPELDGAVVNVEMTRFPRGGVAPAGRVIEILGRPGEFGVDVEILIRKHHLPHDVRAEVLAEARAVAHPVREADLAGRRDFRDLADCHDRRRNGARFRRRRLCAERPGNGDFELQVHIADVSHYVRRASALDREARLRGTSVYFPNRAVPMLPEELSNGICSLNPQEDRLVMSAIMELDANGEIVVREFAPGVIRSAERMTYTNVNAVLECDPEMTEALCIARGAISAPCAISP